MQRRRPAVASVVVFAMFAASACATPGDDAAAAADAFSSCPSDGESSGVEHLATAQRWLRLLALPDEDDLPRRDLDGTMSATFVVREASTADDLGPQRTENLSLHGSLVPGIRWALEHDAAAFAALQSDGLAEETVSYVVVLSPGAPPFFVGACTRRVRDAAPGDHADRMRRLVGLTDAEAIRRTVRLP